MKDKKVKKQGRKTKGTKGKIVPLHRTKQDITERKKAEEELKAFEERFSSLAERSFDIIFMTDAQGYLTYISAASERIFHYKPEEMVGTHFKNYLIESEIPRVSQRFAENMQGRNLGILPMEAMRKDGSHVFVELNSSPIVRDGETIGIQGIIRDITERKRAEQKLLEHQEQLKQLASELTLAEERERRRIADGLHDQISQSLASSKIELDALRHRVSPKDPGKALKEVSDSIGKAINDMRTLTFDLSFPILYELGFEAAVSTWLADRVEGKYGIKTEFEEDRQPKPLDEDVRIFLFRDVRELLMNVVKHAQAKKVKVSIRRVSRQIQVRVEDDGVGFDPEKVAATAVRKGGFGLFSIRERLEQLGGQLEIESARGQGCRVTVTAPLRGE